MKQALALMLFVLIFPIAPSFSMGAETVEPGPTIPEISSLASWEHGKSVNIFIVIGGGAKFGNSYIYSGRHWYLAGGFLGDLPRFASEELGVRSGTVVYVTDSISSFRYSRNPELLKQIFLEHVGQFNFAVCTVENCKSALPQEFRQYYDENNEKIEYTD